MKTPYTGPSLCGANQGLIQPSGQCTVRVFIDGLLHHIQCAVLTPCAHQLILGWDFLSSASAVISCQQPAIQLTDTEHSSPYDAPATRLVVSADHVLPPGRETIISIRTDKIRDGDILVVPSDHFLPKGIVIAPCLVRFSHGSALLAAANTSPEPILLHGDTTVASVAHGDTVSIVPLGPLSTGARSYCAEPAISALAATISPDVTPEQSQSLLALLEKHKFSFDSFSATLGQTSAAAHRIETDSPHIIRRRPYRVSSSERRIIEENVSDMLQRNIIRPSASSWSSPVVLVRKKDGSVRFCVDYRALNKITRKDVYPMPRIDDALDCLQGAEYFSSLDLRSGYWQIPMHEPDKEKTAFSTPTVCSSSTSCRSDCVTLQPPLSV